MSYRWAFLRVRTMTTANSGKTAKPRGKPFKPGKSGNPEGRPKLTPEALDLQAACREKTDEALAVLLRIMNSGENERNQMAAAIAIIERGHGKAKESIELSGGVVLSIAEQIKLAHANRT